MKLKLTSFIFDIKPGETGCECSACLLQIPAEDEPTYIRQPRGVLPAPGAFYRFHRFCYLNNTIEIENQVGKQMSLLEAIQLHEMRLATKSRLEYQNTETGELGAFIHGTSFRIMKYRNLAGDEITVWNSRDGKCPYVLDNDGVDFFHIKWQEDEFAPEHKPKIGEFLVRDADEDEISELVKQDCKNFRNELLKQPGAKKQMPKVNDIVLKHKLQMRSVYKNFPLLCEIVKND